MSTPATSSPNPRAPRPTIPLAVGATLLVGVSLLAGAVLRGGGIVAAVCVLSATTAAIWLFVLFAERAGRARGAAATASDGAVHATGAPSRTDRVRTLPFEAPREVRESIHDVTATHRRRDVAMPEEEERTGRISGTARRLRVLLIDDEELVLRSTARLLEMRGYSVLTARDYTEALAVAEREPELLLAVTDVVLSGISGKEVVRALRQLHPRLRVVYVSGYDVASSGIHLATDGSEEFLPKPFAPAMLDRRLRALLGLGERAEEVVSIGA